MGMCTEDECGRNRKVEALVWFRLRDGDGWMTVTHVSGFRLFRKWNKISNYL